MSNHLSTRAVNINFIRCGFLNSAHHPVSRTESRTVSVLQRERLPWDSLGRRLSSVVQLPSWIQQSQTDTVVCGWPQTTITTTWYFAHAHKRWDRPRAWSHGYIEGEGLMLHIQQPTRWLSWWLAEETTQRSPSNLEGKYSTDND